MEFGPGGDIRDWGVYGIRLYRDSFQTAGGDWNQGKPNLIQSFFLFKLKWQCQMPFVCLAKQSGSSVLNIFQLEAAFH